MNSRTSRPRSPISATTDTAASVPRATIDSSVDLPTPEPAMMLIRWPRPQGTSASSARTPRPTWRSTSERLSASGASFSTGTRGRSASEGPPSRGRPSPSSTRPWSARPTGTSSGAPVLRTGAPVRRPVFPSGRQTTPCGVLATTSAGTAPASPVTSTRPPTAASTPRASRCRPLSSTSRPRRCGRAASSASSTRVRPVLTTVIGRAPPGPGPARRRGWRPRRCRWSPRPRRRGRGWGRRRTRRTGRRAPRGRGRPGRRGASGR